NALWLRTLAVAGRIGAAPEAVALAARCRDSFARFVRPDGLGLLDVVDGPYGDDWSVRPNQLLAVSLPDGPLPDGPAAGAAVSMCRSLLATPLGLRSLGPGHEGYRPHHRGSPAE